MGSQPQPSIDLSSIDIPPPTTLEQIRTSKLRPFGPVLSGIDKQLRSGKLYVSPLGLSEDEHDLTFHGGPDKAIHQYCSSNYSFWHSLYPSPEILAKFVPGGFGENFVADGLNESNVCIGDLVRIGPAGSTLTGGANGCLLEVSLPRQPCFKLNQRFGIKNFAPRTHQEAKTGWYYRVKEEGWIHEGMEIRIVRRTQPKWSIARLHHYVHRDTKDDAVTEELAAIEVIGNECRKVFIKRLRKIQSKNARRSEAWVPFTVKSKSLETPRIVRLELERVRKSESPEKIDAGSHAYIKLPNGLRRAYSVVRGNTDCFVLGVARDDSSRGGSTYIHDKLTLGDTIGLASIGAGMSRDQMASNHIFIAGGIGITAFLAMMERLSNINQTFHLHYAVREASEVAFTDLLSRFSADVTIYDKSKGQRMNIPDILTNRVWNSHVYICGPQRMIDGTVEAASAAGMTSDEIHYEVFEGADTTGDPFTVDVLSNETKGPLEVESEQSLLDVMRDAGFDIGSSCGVGNCGTCRVPVKSGRVQHRGTALTEIEQKTEMLACVSRGIGHIVVGLPE
ncbi:vanillate O-demethylase oxidoreductase [Aaosphaeria arxii CBS 175.79]|uniref:Vanillate O-demethylase oxidoreductase n=1 Tax=Aaosphaeria arxii CBS 175.79 TaxID=1450172 RepID=A0A6A5Y2C8_9PLEO|nr:vanillate O-demethylase oxidoreductase [Aaosphaeria arxii CBS 175.79]KAF2019598.1 vanillate O-demethylase oxidoreductase [Aaosphaeria arxii CBS 175.79]